MDKATFSMTFMFPVMRFLFYEKTQMPLPFYDRRPTIWASTILSYCACIDWVPLYAVFSFFVTAVRLFYLRVWDFIDRTLATDFVSAFHLCPVFLTQQLTCRLTRGVKSAQFLETALELKPMFGLGGTVFNLVLYKMCTIEFRWRKPLNCLQLKRGYSLPVFYLCGFFQQPAAVASSHPIICPSCI